MYSLTKLISIGLFLTSLLEILTVNGVHVNIFPSLEFRGGAQRLRINPGSMEDMSTYSELLSYLPTATEYCIVGIWRFYPYTSFNMDPGTQFAGYTLGRVNETLSPVPTCYNLTATGAGNIGRMKSYRYLGPPNLSVKSISIYSQAYNSGTQYIWETQYDDKLVENVNAEIPRTNLPFDVKSYMITAPTYNVNVENVDDTTKPVYKITDDHGQDFCFALNKPTTAGVPSSKIYISNQMDSDDPLVFDSMAVVKSAEFVTPTINGCLGATLISKGYGS